MVLKVVARRLPVYRRLVAVQIVGVAHNPVVDVIRRIGDAVWQQCSRGAGHGAREPVADVVIAVLDVGVGTGFFGQLALVIVEVVGRGIACRRAAFDDRIALAVEAQAVMVGRDDGASWVSIWLRCCYLAKGGSTLGCQGTGLLRKEKWADAKKTNSLTG